MSHSDLSVGSVVYDSRNGEEMTVEDIKPDGTVVWSDGVSETPNSVNGCFDRGDYELR